MSNYWLENELKKFDFNYKIQIKLDKIRTSPNKNKKIDDLCVGYIRELGITFL